MYALSCPTCLAALPGAATLIQAVQAALQRADYPGTVSPDGTWNDKLRQVLSKYQQDRGFRYTGGKPEYWSVDALLAATVGSPAYWEWAAMYQQATGSKPDEAVFKIQLALRKLGFEPGPIDGLSGTQTTAAIRTWQKTKGAAQTGKLSVLEVAALIAESAAPDAAAAKVVETLAQAEAAGVPIVDMPDESVAAVQVVVVRDPSTQAMVRVERLVPVPRKLVPWMWIGLGTATVLAVGGAIALIVRARKKPAALTGTHNTPIHVVYRKRPGKKPFQVATFATRGAADEFTHSRPDCYVVSDTTSTAAERALMRSAGPRAPWIRLKGY